MATKDEVRLGKVHGKPQSLMVTPVHIGQMQVGQMCAFRMAHEGTSHRQATDCVPLPLNTTAGEAADMIKRMNLNPDPTPPPTNARASLRVGPYGVGLVAALR